MSCFSRSTPRVASQPTDGDDRRSRRRRVLRPPCTAGGPTAPYPPAERPPTGLEALCYRWPPDEPGVPALRLTMSESGRAAGGSADHHSAAAALGRQGEGRAPLGPDATPSRLDCLSKEARRLPTRPWPLTGAGPRLRCAGWPTAGHAPPKARK